jgi:hypothetical protein
MGTKDVLGDYVRQVRESSQQYTRDLMAENEKLFALALQVHTEKENLEEELEVLRTKLERYQVTERSLLDKVTDMEQTRKDLASRYVEVEQSNNNLASLYVASYGVHASLERADVLRSIHEVLANIVGTEEFGIVERPPEGGAFALTSSMGLGREAIARIKLDEGRIGEALDGAPFVHGREAQSHSPGEEHLTACIPLTVGGRVHGAILIFRLLSHKPSLEAVDQELFDLLATHAASALYCCELHSRMKARLTEAAQ